MTILDLFLPVDINVCCLSLGYFFYHILQNKKGNFFFTTMSKSELFQDATILRNLGNRSPQAKLKIFLKP